MPAHWTVDYDPNDPAGKFRLNPPDPMYSKILEIAESQVSGNNYL
jgi:hypothetical protein